MAKDIRTYRRALIEKPHQNLTLKTIYFHLYLPIRIFYASLIMKNSRSILGRSCRQNMDEQMKAVFILGISTGIMKPRGPFMDSHIFAHSKAIF